MGTHSSGGNDDSKKRVKRPGQRNETQADTKRGDGEDKVEGRQCDLADAERLAGLEWLDLGKFQRLKLWLLPDRLAGILLRHAELYGWWFLRQTSLRRLFSGWLFHVEVVRERVQKKDV